ncbi:hypothetical protein [Nocardiopsis ganjiahuensis]|uniref:hypothetical protein n=1 Tax=Nocardiopsis ganjiahuensis TaxID=239984 RepID=UPI000375F9DA|nr:hypothetical protein [Nocardiopsis ganjiahuensis]
MGASWVPVRPLPGTAPEAVGALFAEHTRLAREAERAGPGSSGHTGAQAAFEEAGDRLLGTVEPAVNGDGRRRTFPVAAMAESPVLPPRWRREAPGSMAPAEAARSVERWRTWTGWVREGRIPHFMAAMRTRERARVLLRKWDRAADLAESTRGLPLSWAGGERLELAREAIPGREPPLAVPGERRPPDHPEDDRPEPNEFWVRSEVDAFARNLAEALHEYDQCVPRRWRAGPVPIEPEPGDDPWLTEFLDWAEPFTRDGWGLYLWR